MLTPPWFAQHYKRRVVARSSRINASWEQLELDKGRIDEHVRAARSWYRLVEPRAV